MRLLITCMTALVIAGCGNPPPPDNRGDACVDLGASLCGRAQECGLITDIDRCESSFVLGCCGDAGTCGRSEDLREDAWYSCLDDLEALQCSRLDPFLPPTSCQIID